MQAILEQNQIAEFINNREARVFGDKIGVLAGIFGCWHSNLSRPFTSSDAVYRACIQCGARTPFDPETLRTHGSFHFPPEISLVSKG